MSSFEWDDCFRLGLPEVDRQHQRWFELTNTFLDLVNSGVADQAAVQVAMQQAFAHARRHFRAEEALMRRIGFPKREYEWHAMTHNAFLERFNALAKRCRQGKTTVVAELAAFMSGWLTKHILEVDIKYIGFYMIKMSYGPGGK